MPTPYHKIDDRMRYCEAHCPKCLWSTIKPYGRGNNYCCANCGWTGHYEEMAFMKLRNHPDGLITGARKPIHGRGRPAKYGEDMAERVAKHYRDTGDAIWETARRFGVSHATAARMIYRVNGRSKQISGRPRKYSDSLIREVNLHHKHSVDTIKQIAEKFKLPYDTVRYMVRKQGTERMVKA